MDEIELQVRTPSSEPPAQAVHDVPHEITDADVPLPRRRERAAWYPRSTGRQAAVFVGMVIYTMVVAAITTTCTLHITHAVAPRNLLTMSGITCSSSDHKSNRGVQWSCDKAYDGETSGPSGGWVASHMDRSADGEWIKINFPKMVTLTSLAVWPLCKLFDQYGRWDISTANHSLVQVWTGCRGGDYYEECDTVPMQTFSLPYLETTYIRLTGQEDCGGVKPSSNGVRELKIYDIDDCAEEPCQHGGTCVDKVNNYTCVCPPDFHGQRCQIEVSRNGTIGAAPRNLLTMSGINCSSSDHKMHGDMAWSCDKAYDGKTPGYSGGWVTSHLDGSADGEWIQINFQKLVTLTSLAVWPLCNLFDQYGRWDISTANHSLVQVRTGCNGTSYYKLCDTVPMQTFSLPSLETTYIRLTGQEDCGGDEPSSNGVRELKIYGWF